MNKISVWSWKERASRNTSEDRDELVRQSD